MHCLPPSPQWTVAWGTLWEKMWFWDPLKIHLFPITLNSENFSFAKNITMAFIHLFLGLFDSFLPSAMKALRTMVSTCFHVSSAWPEEWVILQFRREQCLSAPSPVSLGSPRALGLVQLDRGAQERCLCCNHIDLCLQTGSQNLDSSWHGSEAETSRSP